MKLSQHFPLITSLYIMFVMNARELAASDLTLRGSENYRELQEDDCSYLGDVGWWFCTDTEFKCKDGFVCNLQKGTYVGVICVNTTCATGDKDDGETDDKDGTDDKPNPDESCWEKACFSNSDCVTGSNCFEKGDSCLCRNPMYTSTCEKWTGAVEETYCSLTKEPAPVLTEAPTPSPTPGPTTAPEGNPKAKKLDRPKKVKGRHLSHVNDLKGNIPQQGM
jgi:hypothetical protein